MKGLLIIGAGEFGQVVKELAEMLDYERIGFLDDNADVAIGKVEEYQKFKGEYNDFIVAIGNPIIRRKIVETIKNEYVLCSLIHPTAIVSKSASIEKGCVIEANVVINTSAQIGTACFINAGSVVNHNSIVSDYCQVDCNAVIEADAIVPENMKVTSCSVWKEK